jgi:hypothetical protein
MSRRLSCEAQERPRIGTIETTEVQEHWDNTQKLSKAVEMKATTLTEIYDQIDELLYRLGAGEG